MSDYEQPGLTDEFQIRNLGHRQGDISARHNSNARWGATVMLRPGDKQTLISTDMFDRNIPMAYQLRFSVDGINYSAALPSASDGCVIDIRKSVDLKAGAANEHVTLFGGNSQPSCTVICRQLVVSIKNLAGEGGANLSVQAAACPVSMVDCDDVLGRNGSWANAVSEEIQVQDGLIVALPPNANRAQFFVQNFSTDSDLLIAFGPNADFGPPVVGAIILPANVPNSVYESPLNGYTGEVSLRWSNGSGTGGAIITEGTF